MKWVKRGCQEQYWKDKVSEGTLLLTHFALGKKTPGKVITWGLSSNQLLSHSQPLRARTHHNYALLQTLGCVPFKY